MRRIPSSYMRIYFWDGLLVEHLKEVPVHVIPCIEARTKGQPIFMQSTVWGSIAPASWSFMLAARCYGLGTSWTGLHLFFEEEGSKYLEHSV